MNTRTFGLQMGVGRVSRPLRRVGGLAMPDAGLHTKRCVESVCEVLLGDGVLRLLVPGVAVRVIIDPRFVLDRLISATRQLSSEDERVEF